MHNGVGKPPQVNLVLVGMPGVGKSTVGVLLAKQLGYGFLDTDIYIQEREGRKLPGIIADRGIEGFKKCEERAILSLAPSAHVIATGGSVVYSRRSMQHLGLGGRIVFLDIAPGLLAQRLDNLDARGVVYAPGQTLSQLYRERHPLYVRYADITVVCDGLSPEEVKAEIIEHLGGLLTSM